METTNILSCEDDEDTEAIHQNDREGEMMRKFFLATKQYLKNQPGEECLLATLGNSEVKSYIDWFKTNTTDYSLQNLIRKCKDFEIIKNEKLANVVKLIDSHSVSEEKDLNSVLKKFFDSVKSYLSSTGNGKCVKSKLYSTEPMKTYLKYLDTNLPTNTSILSLFKKRSTSFRIIQNPADEDNFVVTLSKPKAPPEALPKRYEEYKEFSLRKAQSLMAIGGHGFTLFKNPQLNASNAAMSSSMSNLYRKEDISSPTKEELIDEIYDLLLNSPNGKGMFLTELQNKAQIQKIWNKIIKEEPTIKFVTFLKQHFVVEKSQNGTNWVISLPEDSSLSEVTSLNSEKATAMTKLLNRIDNVFKEEGKNAVRLQTISGDVEVCQLWKEVGKDFTGDKKFLGFLKGHYKMEKSSDSWTVFANEITKPSADEKLCRSIFELFKERNTECLLLDNISPTATDSMKKLWAVIQRQNPHIKYIDFVRRYFDVHCESGEKPQVFLRKSEEFQNKNPSNAQKFVRKKSDNTMLTDYVEGNFVSAVVEFLDRRCIPNLTIDKLHLMDDNIKSAWEYYNQQASHPRTMKEVLLKYPKIFKLSTGNGSDIFIELVERNQAKLSGQMQQKEMYKSFQDLSLHDIIASQNSVSSYNVSQTAVTPSPATMSSYAAALKRHTVGPYMHTTHKNGYLETQTLSRSTSIGNLHRGAFGDIHKPHQDNFEQNVRSAINDVFAQSSLPGRYHSSNPPLQHSYNSGLAISNPGFERPQEDINQHIARLKENLDNYCLLKGICHVDVVFTRLGDQKICNVNLNHVTIGEHSAPSKEEAECNALLKASQWLIELFLPQ